MTEKELQAKGMLQDIAKELKEKLPENMGFALLTYEFEDGPDKKMLYVSNSNRESVIRAMLEFVNKNMDDPELFGKNK